MPNSWWDKQQPFLRLKNKVVETAPTGTWERTFNNNHNIVKLVIDCQSYTDIFRVKSHKMSTIEELTKDLCYSLYVKRLQIMEE